MRDPRRLWGLCLILAVLPGLAHATRIDSAADPALAGALVETFDGEAAGYFTSQTFTIGAHGFTVTPVSNDLHLDTQYCGSFGTSGTCLDTMRTGGQANDDFDVVFTGAPVSAFGFVLNALDVDWTVQTFDASDNLLSTYVITSQSPGLTGNDRRGYFGATEVAPIQSFQVRSAGSDRALIDDFSYTPVPQPGTGILAGLGLMGLASTRARRPRLDAGIA